MRWFALSILLPLAACQSLTDNTIVPFFRPDSVTTVRLFPYLSHCQFRLWDKFSVDLELLDSLLSSGGPIAAIRLILFWAPLVQMLVVDSGFLLSKQPLLIHTSSFEVTATYVHEGSVHFDLGT